jgi:hypothetical protein
LQLPQPNAPHGHRWRLSSRRQPVDWDWGLLAIAVYQLTSVLRWSPLCSVRLHLPVVFILMSQFTLDASIPAKLATAVLSSGRKRVISVPPSSRSFSINQSDVAGCGRCGRCHAENVRQV